MHIFIPHCLHQKKRNDDTESWGKIIKTLDKNDSVFTTCASLACINSWHSVKWMIKN